MYSGGVEHGEAVGSRWWWWEAEKGGRGGMSKQRQTCWHVISRPCVVATFKEEAQTKHIQALTLSAHEPTAHTQAHKLYLQQPPHKTNTHLLPAGVPAAHSSQHSARRLRGRVHTEWTTRGGSQRWCPRTTPVCECVYGERSGVRSVGGCGGGCGRKGRQLDK